MTETQRGHLTTPPTSALIPQPSSLEDVVFNAVAAGYAKGALRNEKTLGETSKEIDSIVNEVLKGGV